MFDIAMRELRGLFLSPLAWSILAIVQFILAYLFLANLEHYQTQFSHLPEAPGVTEWIVGVLFGGAGLILLMLTPLLTMHLIAGERRNNTLSLLLSAPVSITQIILGKYFGVMSFMSVMLVLLALMPLSLLSGTPIDIGQLSAGFLGVALLCGAFCAIGLFMSTLTSSPAIAAVSTFGGLLFLWIIDWAGQADGDRGILQYLSLLNHYQPLLEGLFSSADVIYYLLVIALFLILSIRRLDAERL